MIREKHYCPASGEVEYWTYHMGCWSRTSRAAGESWPACDFRYIEWAGRDSLPHVEDAYPPRIAA